VDYLKDRIRKAVNPHIRESPAMPSQPMSLKTTAKKPTHTEKESRENMETPLI
jgi:hypothetical protein